jgi:TrmH family RNA methyltransferase
MRSSFPPRKAGPVTRTSITSTRNPQLKAVRRLRRSRVRDREGVFIAEGRRQLESALDAGARITCVYAAPSLYLGDGDDALVRRAVSRGARIVELGADAFRSITSQVRPDGIVAVVERPGTIVRTAEAAGAGGLVACDAGTDVFHPEAVRGSVGTVFDLPLARASCGETLAWAAEQRLRVIVATPGGDRPVWEADYSASGLAVVVGGERYGVDAAWIGAADQTVRIPMWGRADSLNVAVAAGIVLFEAARQRAMSR